MHVERPTANNPTPEEVQELEALKARIERAIADGILTHDEFDSLKATIFNHGTPSADQLYRELTLYRTLVTEKINQGELEYQEFG
jgi:glucose-6-phosphate dehydrogenase assembly protein OpcA